MAKKRETKQIFNQTSSLVPPVLLLLILSLILSLLWLHERQQNAAKLKELTRVMSQQMAIRIENWVSSRENVVNLFAKSWAAEYAHNIPKFKHDAGNILAMYPGFQAINWIDSTWTIKIVNPDSTNRLALGKNLHKHPFPTVQSALLRALRSGKIASTPPIHLLQGGAGFVAYIPVRSKENKTLGFINVVFRIDTLIHYCLNDSFVNDHFNYVIYSNKTQPIYGKGNIPDDAIAAMNFKAQAPVHIIDQEWLVTLFPKKEFIAQEMSPSNNRYFFFNLLFSLIIAFLIWMLLLRNRRLKQSEEHFKTLFDSANTWIQMIALDGTIIDVNKAFLSALSLKKQDVLQKNFLDFLSMESKALFKTILSDIEQNTQFQTELKAQIGKDDIRYLNCFGSVVYDKMKKPQYIILHEVDITDRKFYQAKLNESEEKYRALTEQSLIGVYLIQNNKLIYVNPKFAEIFGFQSPDEVDVAQDISDFISESDRQKFRQTMSDLIEDRLTEMHMEVEGKRKDGFSVALEAFGKRILLNGQPAILGTLIDVSVRKRYLETIRKLSNAVNQSPVATIIANVEGKIEYVNPAFMAITGYALDDINGEMSILFKKLHLPQDIYEDILHRIQSGNLWQGEISSKKKDETTFWQRLLVNPVKDDHGQVTHYLIIMIDISTRKKLENELTQKQKMEAIGRLAGGIAHDFNNLLTVINGYSQLILHTMDKENSLYSKIEQIFQAGERAKNLTSQLLAFSRKQIRQPAPVNLSQLVHEIEKMLTRLIGEDIEIICALADDLWSVETDKNQIEQIILNLAINARQAMPDGGKIIIRTENYVPEDSMLKKYPEIKPGKYVCLSIEDTGIGMDEETQKHIFEPFFTTKPVGQGTGLGLATVYGIVKQNDGYIYVESKLNLGTKFSIYLPAAEKEAQTTFHQMQSTENLNGNETIFLVEDDPSVRELTLRSLNYFGYNVIVATNGEEALEKFGQNNTHFDLLITDVIMPGIGGKKLVDLLRKKDPTLKVLFMSGYSADQISKKGVLNEEINFIQKPFAPMDLIKRIRQILDEASN